MLLLQSTNTKLSLTLQQQNACFEELKNFIFKFSHKSIKTVKKVHSLFTIKMSVFLLLEILDG